MKFKYGDKVKIIDGFYKGQEGEVRTFIDNGAFFQRFSYLIILDDSSLETAWVTEKHLKLEEQK